MIYLFASQDSIKKCVRNCERARAGNCPGAAFDTNTCRSWMICQLSKWQSWNQHPSVRDASHHLHQQENATKKQWELMETSLQEQWDGRAGGQFPNSCSNSSLAHHHKYLFLKTTSIQKLSNNTRSVFDHSTILFSEILILSSTATHIFEIKKTLM